MSILVKAAIVLGACAAFVVAWAVVSLVLHCVLGWFCEFAEPPKKDAKGGVA